MTFYQSGMKMEEVMKMRRIWKCKSEDLQHDRYGVRHNTLFLDLDRAGVLTRGNVLWYVDIHPHTLKRPTSNRERRLWFWALAVIVAIYSTLGLAGRLASYLRERNLLDNTFFIAFLLVVAAIAGSGLLRRPKRIEIWVALGVTAVYATVLLRLFLNPEERTHLFEYGLVAVLIYQALAERARNGRRVPAPAVLAVVVTALLGLLDEGIQAILPNRVYDIRDVGFNALSGLMAVAASLALAWARRWRWR